MARRRHPEDELQVAVAKWLRLQHPHLMAWHTPNGGRRDAREAARFAGMGVRPGVPDWTILLPSGLAAFLELKSDVGRLAPSQREFRDAVTVLGCPYVVCRSLGEVMAAFEQWRRAGLLADAAVPFDVRHSVAMRARGVLGDVPLPWAGVLAALLRHLDVHADPQFYTKRDAADLEAIAAEVRRRVEVAEAERMRVASDRPAAELSTSASGRG